MNAGAYARAQKRALGPLLRLLRALLHALGMPVGDAAVLEFATRLYRPMLTARDLNYAAAVTFLRSQELPSGLIIPAPRDFPLAALTSTVDEVSTTLRVAGEPVTATNRTDPVVLAQAQKALGGPVTRQALEPARETVQDIGEDDAHPAVGWARMLVGAYSCSFCAMLASRGPVFSSRETAIGRGGNPLDAYHSPHPNKNGKIVGGTCDCIAVPIVKGQPWEGRAAYKKLNALWNDTMDTKEPGDDALNAFRRSWDKMIREDDTHQFVAETIAPIAAA